MLTVERTPIVTVTCRQCGAALQIDGAAAVTHCGIEYRAEVVMYTHTAALDTEMLDTTANLGQVAALEDWPVKDDHLVLQRVMRAVHVLAEEAGDRFMRNEHGPLADTEPYRRLLARIEALEQRRGS